MFEVIYVGPPTKKRLFRPSLIPVKMRATAPMACEYLRRSFEGHGHYSTQTYRADFREGDVITLYVHGWEMIAVGDQRSAESLAGQGYLGGYFRMVATTG